MTLWFSSLHTATVPFLAPVNFDRDLNLFKENSSVNFTAQIMTYTSLTSTPIWARINVNLPKDTHIVQYSKDGNIYTSMIIDKLSNPNDFGIYCVSASNQCGASSLCVYLCPDKGKVVANDYQKSC